MGIIWCYWPRLPLLQRERESTKTGLQGGIQNFICTKSHPDIRSIFQKISVVEVIQQGLHINYWRFMNSLSVCMLNFLNFRFPCLHFVHFPIVRKHIGCFGEFAVFLSKSLAEGWPSSLYLLSCIYEWPHSYNNSG